MANLKSTLTVALVDDVSKPARSVAQSLKEAERAAKDVAKGMANTGASDRLQKSLSKLSLSKKDIEQVAKAWQEYAKSAGLAAGSANWTKTQAAQVRAWESQTVAALRKVKSEQAAYNRSIAQAAKKQIMPLAPAAVAGKGRLRGAVSTLAGATGANFVAGAGAEKAAHTMVHKAAEVEQLRFRIRELSRSDPNEAGFADKLAAEVAAKYPGIGLDKALDTYIETRANSVDHHGHVDQTIARRNVLAASRAQNAALALGYDLTPTDMQNLLKGVEGSGRADDPKAVEKITDAYLRAKQVFGSAIASQMVRDYTANAKAANFSVGDEQFFRENLVRMSEGNASRLGNEVNQTLASLKGSMKKSAGKWLVELGIAKPEDMENMGGGAVRFKNGFKGSDLLETQQGTWARTVLKNAIEKKGVLSEDKVAARMKMLRDQELKANPNAQIDENYLRHRATEGLISAHLAKSGFRSTVIDNLAHLIGNEHLLERDTQAMNQASGLGAGDRIAQNPVATWKELTESLQTFATVMGDPAIASVSGTLDSMARGIASFSQAVAEWQKNNPELAKIGSGAAIAGMGAGGAALMYGAFEGLKTGFGLSTAAGELSAAAGALNLAAGKLGAGGVASGAAGAAGAAGSASKLGGLARLGLIGLGIGAGAAIIYGIDQIGPRRAPASGRGPGRIYADPFRGISGEGIHDGDAHSLSGFAADAGYWRQGIGRGVQGQTWVPTSPKAAAPEWFPSQPAGWGLKAGEADAAKTKLQEIDQVKQKLSEPTTISLGVANLATTIAQLNQIEALKAKLATPVNIPVHAQPSGFGAIHRNSFHTGPQGE